MNNNKISQDRFISSIVRKSTSPGTQQARSMAHISTSGAMARNELHTAARRRARRISMAEELYRALPELDMIVAVRTASVLASKDLVTTSLVYTSNNELNIDLNSIMIDVLRDHFENKIQLPKKLYRWLRDAQRTKGAVPIVMLSDAGFDAMFNLVSQESRNGGRINENTMIVAKDFFNKQKGILRPITSNNKKVGVESLFESTVTLPNPQSFDIDLTKVFKPNTGFEKQTLDLTDNANITKFPDIQKKIAAERARTNYFTGGKTPYEGSSLKGVVDEEKLKKMNSFSEANENYDNWGYQSIISEMPSITSDLSNSTDGMFSELSAASVAPVRLGSDSQPIGYLAILEKDGNPVSEKSLAAFDQTFSTIGNDVIANEVTSSAARGMGTDTSSLSPLEISNMLFAKYSMVAEQKMLEIVKNSTGFDSAMLDATNDFYKIMLARHLSKASTQVLYIPAENMAYFAVDFNEDGVGVSIAEKSFVVSTIRMALMFATMNAATANASRHMQYDIEVAPDDMNAQENVARAQADILNAHNSVEPLWGDMHDALAMATNSNIAFNVTGNEYYSTYRVSVSDTTPEYKIPDKEIDDNYLRRTCNLAGVDPDLIMTPENIEFATQIFSKSLLTIQRTMLIQEELSIPLTRFVFGNTVTSRTLMEELGRSAYKFFKETGLEPAEARKEALKALQQFINGIRVTIPSPDTSLGAAQLEQFNARIEHIQKIVETKISDDVADELSKNGLEMSTESLRSMVVSYYMTVWCRKNGIENDFFEMFEPENASEFIKVISDDKRDVADFLMRLAKRTSGKIETVADKVGLEPNEDNSFGSEAPSGDAEGGDDEFSLDDGFGEDEQSEETDTEVDVDADSENDSNPEEETEKEPEEEAEDAEVVEEPEEEEEKEDENKNSF